MKVVINRCFGGFGLSKKATKRLAELQGRECYFYKDSVRGETYTPISIDDQDSSWVALDIPNAHEIDLSKDNAYTKHVIHYDYSIDRSDPLLIQVVEELGKEANREYSRLAIVDIPDDINWTIDEYDGNESVSEVHRSWR